MATSVHCFNVWFQIGKLRKQKHSPLEEAKFPMFLSWDHCWQCGCVKVVNSEWTFSLILDKTTTNQRQKEIDLLFRFWDENINYIVTIYLRSLYFGRATAAHLTCTLTDVMDSDVWHPMGKAVLCIIRCAKHKQDCMEKFE